MFRRYPFTLFSEGVEIRGNLASSGVLEIRGTVKGDIHHQGKVVVGFTGSCESNIVATSVEVAGKIHGNVQTDHLVIHSTGRIYGRAIYKNLVIQDGGVLEESDSEALGAEAGQEFLAVPLGVEARGETPEALPLVEAREEVLEAPVTQARQEPVSPSPASDKKKEAPCVAGRKEPVFYTSF